jgi:hypothetical protein
MDADRIEHLRKSIPPQPIVVLMKQPDPAGHVLDFQTYIMDGVDTMPMFTSPETLVVSLRGGTLGRPTFAVSREILAQMIQGDHALLLDPGLPSQFRFTSGEFREAFPPPPPSPSP